MRISSMGIAKISDMASIISNWLCNSIIALGGKAMFYALLDI